MEVSLLDYGGTTNKGVEYSINEDGSGIYIKGFVLSVKDLHVANPDLKIKADIGFQPDSRGVGTEHNIWIESSDNIEFKVLETIQYKAWRWGEMVKGAGQMGIYKLKDQKGNVYFAVIKDYRAIEGDWGIRAIEGDWGIVLVHIEGSEQELKNWLMVDRLRMIFIVAEP